MCVMGVMGVLWVLKVCAPAGPRLFWRVPPLLLLTTRDSASAKRSSRLTIPIQFLATSTIMRMSGGGGGGGGRCYIEGVCGMRVCER